MIPGELRVVDDVPAAFAELAEGSIRASASRPFRIGCSGGASGSACFSRLAEADISWEAIECYFVDERCVPEGTKDRNDVTVAAALGARRNQLGGFYPMQCADGPDAYAARFSAFAGYDLCQLGVGPDGHTASLFPESDGSQFSAETLVISNADPSGRNPFERLSLTFSAIARSRLVVVAAMGEEKADALRRVAAGEPLPVSKVRAGRVVFLVDRPAAALLSEAR